MPPPGSSNNDLSELPRNPKAHNAMHPDWRLRKEAAIYLNDTPSGPNLLPIANQMHNWLKRQGDIRILSDAERSAGVSFTNPYSYSSSSLAIQLAATINDIADFLESEFQMDPTDSEVRRIRLESELRMLFARFCESAIKQMLYCTNLDHRKYKSSSMGELLVADCKACRKNGTAHHVSLIGALAHHYFECHVLESCLFDHLAFAGSLRNKISAHSDSASPRAVPNEETRNHLDTVLKEVGNELAHMCEHLGSLELKMIAEIQLWLDCSPKCPTIDELLIIPARYT